MLQDEIQFKYTHILQRLEGQLRQKHPCGARMLCLGAELLLMLMVGELLTHILTEIELHMEELRDQEA